MNEPTIKQQKKIRLNNLSLRGKLILFVIIPIIIIYALLLSFNIIKMQQWAVNNIKQQMSKLTQGYAYKFDCQFKEGALIADLTASSIENNLTLTSNQLYTLLRTNLEHNPLIYGSAICFEPHRYDPNIRLFVRYAYRNNNKIIEVDPAATGYDYTHMKQEYWHHPRNTGTSIWTEPYFDEGGGNIFMTTYATPIFKDKSFFGIATVDIPLEPLRELINVGLTDEQQFCIISRSGTYVYAPDKTLINQSIFNLALEKQRDDIIVLAKKLVAGTTDMTVINGWMTDNSEWIFYAPIYSTGWSLAISIPEKHVIATVRDHYLKNLILSFLSLIVILAGLYGFLHYVSTPITRLNYFVSQIAEGNLDARINLPRHDEIGRLASAFNDMACKLSERQKDLVESRQKIQTLLINIPEKIFYKDLNSVYVMCNKQFADDLKITPKQIIGKTDYDFFTKELADKYRTDDQRIINSGNTETIEEDYVLTNGKKYFVQTIKTPVRDKNGTIIGLLGVFIDITERKKVEHERLEFFKRLAAKNKELQTITYTVSHDFKSPITNIYGFINIMRESGKALNQIINTITIDKKNKDQITEILTEDIDNSLHYINISVDKMHDLLEGLLQVSRLGTEEYQMSDLSMNTIINEIIEAKTFEIKQIGAIITIGDLPGCRGDYTRINQVFSNLIHNALKYRSPDRECRIRISGRIDDKWSIYCVEDNGFGIPTKLHERIFEIFYRRQKTGNQEGEGLGLTIVKRILELHNGIIKIESEEDIGSKFFVYLPHK